MGAGKGKEREANHKVYRKNMQNSDSEKEERRVKKNREEQDRIDKE